MMLIKLFIFFLLLLILPDWYIYRAYIHRVSQKWIRRAYCTNIIPGHRDDGDFLYSRANARFHVPAQQLSLDIPMLCRT